MWANVAGRKYPLWSKQNRAIWLRAILPMSSTYAIVDNGISFGSDAHALYEVGEFPPTWGCLPTSASTAI